MHPLVRDLYKRVVHVGRDYPTGWKHVKEVWKAALRKRENCPSFYENNNHQWNKKDSFHLDGKNHPPSKACEEELLRAVYRGRHMVREMIGVIQLKKYRAMKERYGGIPDNPVISSHNVDAFKGGISATPDSKNSP